MINWIDYGYWKNWQSPWGDIAIEQCPYSNRGKLVIKTLTEGAINNLFNPLLSEAYFFDEDRAVQHIQAVTTLALTNLTVEDLRLLRLETVKSQEFKGKDCTCVLDTVLLHPSLINWITFSVKIHPGKEEVFVIDWADKFPRHFLNEEIAQAELQAWMECRRQILE